MFNFKILLFLLILIPFSSGAVNIIDTTTNPVNSQILQGVNILDIREIFDNNTAFVNQSQFWNTVNLGAMDAADAVQHNNVGGVLTISETYLESFGNALWCQLTGCTMAGTIDMDGNIIDNIFQLSALDGSSIAFGDNPIYNSFSGLDQAIITSTNQSLPAGVITHALLDTNSNRIIAAWQSGKNDSGQYTRNSGGYFPDLGITNASILTNMEEMWSRFGIVPFADYFSAENKTSVAALYAFESQKLFLHDDIGQGQLLGEGDFRWISREGLDIDLYNGAGVHIKKDIIKEFGFSIGDSISSFTANFDSNILSPFVQTTGGGLADWNVVANVLCHSEECARALGGSGSPLRSMQANFSSIDQDNLNLSWWLTATQAPSDIFTVTVNNNVGSGDVSVFSSSSTFSDELQSVILPSSMDDKSIVTIIFSFQGNNINNDVVYVDEIIVIGNATTTTLANVTVQDGELNFGNKECGILLSAEDGFQDLNITCDNINLIGNVTAISVTEVSINVTENVDIGGNLTVGGSITLNDTTINDWDDIVSNVSINFGANESDTSGPAIPFLLTNEGVLKIDVVDSGSGSTIWEQVLSEIRNSVGNILNFTGSLFVSGNGNFGQNITVEERVVLGNGASIGWNATCDFIFYDTSGSILETKGCA